LTNVQFHFTDAKGNELCYVDDDGDGRWDRFTEYPKGSSPRSYYRDGLSWKQRAKDVPREPHAVP
jgi:hypothetical protein